MVTRLTTVADEIVIYTPFEVPELHAAIMAVDVGENAI